MSSVWKVNMYNITVMTVLYGIIRISKLKLVQLFTVELVNIAIPNGHTVG